jgi:hypothetical protein
MPSGDLSVKIKRARPVPVAKRQELLTPRRIFAYLGEGICALARSGITHLPVRSMARIRKTPPACLSGTDMKILIVDGIETKYLVMD